MTQTRSKAREEKKGGNDVSSKKRANRRGTSNRNTTTPKSSAKTKKSKSKAKTSSKSKKSKAETIKKSVLPEFAPLNTPLRRRLQTLTVSMHWGILIFSIWVALFLLYLPLTRWPMVAYLTYIAFTKNPRAGGRWTPWVRRLSWWKYFSDFFPTKLIKTHDLDPNKQYLFGVHPHGIISYGPFINIGTEAQGWMDKFPGVIPRLCTLNLNVNLPFGRELILGLGFVSCNKESINYLLEHRTNHAPCLVVGGAQEALYASKGDHKLVLQRRKGFVKLAIKHGASLVPVYTFGENEVYHLHHPASKIVKKIDSFMKRNLGFSAPIFSGRGIFQYSYGILPFRVPLTTVVGAPISTVKNTNPSQTEIERVHKQYMDGLIVLFNMYKDQYAREGEMLEIVE